MRQINCHTRCQLFITDKGFIYVLPMKLNVGVLQTIKFFDKPIGAPEAIICDAAGEKMSNNIQKFCRDIGATLRVLGEGTPRDKRVELYISFIKYTVIKDTKESVCPIDFWDYCVERSARINSMTAKYIFQLHGSKTHTPLTGHEGETSILCWFQWYDWCYFRDSNKAFTFKKDNIGLVLGPEKGEANEMAQWILKGNGKVVPHCSPIPLTIEDIQSATQENKRKTLGILIKGRCGTSLNPPPTSSNSKKNDFEE